MIVCMMLSDMASAERIVGASRRASKFISQGKGQLVNMLGDQDTAVNANAALLLSDVGILVFAVLREGGEAYNVLHIRGCFVSEEFREVEGESVLGSVTRLERIIGSLQEWAKVQMSSSEMIWGISHSGYKATAYTDNLAEITKSMVDGTYSLYLDLDSIDEESSDAKYWSKRDGTASILMDLLGSMEAWQHEQIADGSLDPSEPKAVELRQIAEGMDFLSAPTVKELVQKFKFFISIYSMCQDPN